MQPRRKRLQLRAERVRPRRRRAEGTDRFQLQLPQRFEKYLNFTFMGNVARDNAEALRQLALAPEPPTKARLTGAVTPDAKVSWAADDDAERAGFEILWRETSDPRWTVYDFAAAPGETVLKGVSTDNHFFAVRAVGKNGARSIAVPTEIERRPPPLPSPSKQ